MGQRSFVGVRGRGEIVLPADLRRRHHLDRPGAQVEVVERDDGVIELRPQIPVPADQAWFWTQEWQQGERRVDQHVAAREVAVSADIDEFVRELDAVRSQHPRSRRR